MKVPISAYDVLDIFEPGGQHSVIGVERAQRLVKLIGEAKSIMLDLMEQKIVELQNQNTALQAHNSELLLRSRVAEHRLKELGVA